MSLRCLLADDSEEFLASAARLLEAQGFEIVGYATSSEQALELADVLEPDLVLVDVELGDEDGIALAAELEARVPSSRVVLISAYAQDDVIDVISRSSAAGFLPKSSLSAAAIAEVLG
jgi:DNA-binding NarL/FixJ family response regulator